MNLPKHLLKNIDLISAKLLAEKKANLLWEKQLPKREKYFMLTWTLAEKKCDFYFYQNLCQEKTCLDKLDNQADFGNLAKPAKNKTETTKQSQSKPLQTETPAKNLEADFCDSTKQTRIYANEETAANEKAKNLKTCLLKKYWPKTLLWKVPPLQRVLNSYANLKRKPANQIWFWFCSLALPPNYGIYSAALYIPPIWGVIQHHAV